MRFRVTYEVITPASAEHGDVEEHGFIEPGEWKTPIDAAMRETDSAFDMDLRSAVDLVGCVRDQGAWFSSTDPIVDYRSGAEEYRSLRPPAAITPSSYRRIARLLNA